MARGITAAVGMLASLMVAGLGSGCDRPPAATAPLDSVPAPAEGPPPPPEGAFLGQMTPTQTSQLASLGVAVVVPGQVPPDFGIVELRVDSSGPGYLVVYQRPPGGATDQPSQCFAVEFASDGLGDAPATEGRLTIQPPLFGGQSYGLNYGPFTDPGLKADFPQPNLFTDWMAGPAGAYRLVGATYIAELFESLKTCQDLSPEEAAALAESLTVLAADPMGEPPPMP